MSRTGREPVRSTLKKRVRKAQLYRESGVPVGIWVGLQLLGAILKQKGSQQEEVPQALSKACSLGFQPGCDNAERFRKRPGDIRRPLPWPTTQFSCRSTSRRESPSSAPCVRRSCMPRRVAAAGKSPACGSRLAASTFEPDQRDLRCSKASDRWPKLSCWSLKPSARRLKAYLTRPKPKLQRLIRGDERLTRGDARLKASSQPFTRELRQIHSRRSVADPRRSEVDPRR